MGSLAGSWCGSGGVFLTSAAQKQSLGGGLRQQPWHLWATWGHGSKDVRLQGLGNTVVGLGESCYRCTCSWDAQEGEGVCL